MANKRLGQHFLTDTRVLEIMLKTAQLSKEDTVLEVGPGEGVLTEKLLAQAGKVVAVEKDPTLTKTLRERFERDIGQGSLMLYEGDIRDIPLEKLGLVHQKFSVVANIPYYLTGLLIRELLSGKVQPQKVVLLIQKEVAERIARSSKENLLSLAVKAYGTPHFVASVPQNAFKPQPSVESAVLSIDHISRNFFTNIDEGAFFEALKAGFGKKRKQLANNLSLIYPKEFVERTLEHLGYSKNIRAEDLSLEKWKELLQALTRIP